MTAITALPIEANNVKKFLKFYFVLPTKAIVQNPMKTKST